MACFCYTNGLWIISKNSAINIYVKVAFFRGAELKPMPPGVSKQKGVRYFDIYEDTALDETLMVEWIRQASALPGWEP